jgi:hypothetical protein
VNDTNTIPSPSVVNDTNTIPSPPRELTGVDGNTTTICDPQIASPENQTIIRLASNNTTGDTSGCNPEVAISDNSTYVVWSDGEEEQRDIFLKKFDPKTGEEKLMEISTDLGSGSTFNPHITVSRSNVYVVWQADSDNTGNQDIFFKRSVNNGATFGDTVNLSNDTAGSGNPFIATSGNNVHVVWGGTTPGDNDIFYRKSTDNGSTFKDTKNLSNNAGISFKPMIRASDTSLEVSWRDNSNGNYDDVFSLKSGDSGTNFGSVVKERNNDRGMSEEKLYG